MEFRQQLKYPPFSRVALLTLKGRNEEKVKFAAEFLKRELEKLSLAGGAGVSASHLENSTSGSSGDSLHPISDLKISGPAPAPLARAENFYRYQIMLRTRAMSKLSHALANITAALALPDDVTLAVDIDPVDLS
jgi:primosomal protein N' (replication factor Y)